jgi:hypothetical protein
VAECASTALRSCLLCLDWKQLAGQQLCCVKSLNENGSSCCLLLEPVIDLRGRLLIHFYLVFIPLSAFALFRLCV